MTKSKPSVAAEVAELVTQGWGRRKISNHLGITENQAKHYIERCRKTMMMESGITMDDVLESFPSKRGTVQVTDGEIKTKWLRFEQTEEEVEQWVERLCEKVKGKGRSVKLPKKSSTVNESKMLEITMFDAHIGKYSSEKETGTKWNIQHSCDVYFEYAKQCIADCGVTKGAPLGKILLTVGGDFFHSDNRHGYTEKSKNALDMDGTHDEIIDAACQLMTDVIDMLQLYAKEIEVIIIPGNHDHESSKWFNRVLNSYYRNVDSVHFNMSGSTRKYIRWGTCLIGITNGDKEKWGDLPVIMAQEQRMNWAETTEHYWHIGHTHKKKQSKFIGSDTVNGVEILVMQTLTSVDTWHHEMGYCGNVQRAEAFLYDKKYGRMNIFDVKISRILDALKS